MSNKKVEQAALPEFTAEQLQLMADMKRQTEFDREQEELLANWGGMEVNTQIRDSLGYMRRLDFDHITENAENKARYDFVIENDGRSGIDKRLQLGWQMWRVDDKNKPLDSFTQANRVDKGYACASAGECGGDKPGTAYLMYIIKGHQCDIANSEARKLRRNNAMRGGVGIGVDTAAMNATVNGAVSIDGASFAQGTSNSPIENNIMAGINQVAST